MPKSSLTINQLLAAYARGYFPMADGRESEEIRWYHPERRGILPLDAFHIPRTLQRFLRKCPYEVKVDTDFAGVIRACADARSLNRTDTWINDTMIAMYCDLAHLGAAHSVECWLEDRLVGGLYGVSLGGAFFGESMFSHAANASKVALTHLVERLRSAGYLLLDTQYVNDHLKQFGVLEISREDYLALLANALKASPNPSTRFLTASDIKS